MEPSVPSVNAVDEALIKFQWYANLAVDAREWGWKVQICLVEVSCRGFVASSTARLLTDVGIRGQDHRRASKRPCQRSQIKQSLAWDQKGKSTLDSQVMIMMLATRCRHAVLLSLWWACFEEECPMIKKWKNQQSLGTKLNVCDALTAAWEHSLMNRSKAEGGWNDWDCNSHSNCCERFW